MQMPLKKEFSKRKNKKKLRCLNKWIPKIRISLNKHLMQKLIRENFLCLLTRLMRTSKYLIMKAESVIGTLKTNKMKKMKHCK
jgi:hypothetical protein